MFIENKKALDSARNSVCCLWCRKACRPDAAHIYSKGAGVLDVEWNVVPLCRECHTHSHSGKSPTTEELLAIVAKRWNCRPADLTRARHTILQLDKGWDEDKVDQHMKENHLSKTIRNLVWIAWEGRQ